MLASQLIEHGRSLRAQHERDRPQGKLGGQLDWNEVESQRTQHPQFLTRFGGPAGLFDVPDLEVS